MVTIFLMAANFFIATYGESYTGRSFTTQDVNISQAEVEEQLQETSNAFASGDPLQQVPAFLGQTVGSFLLVIDPLLKFVSGYYTVLTSILPVEFHPIALTAFILLTFLQVLTIFYLFLVVVSAVRGGSV